MATRPSPVIAHSKASSIWNLYGLTSPGELVLEDIALAMGVLVIEGRLDGADARLLRKGSKGIIRVKESIPERGRKRFAIAHELERTWGENVDLSTMWPNANPIEAAGFHRRGRAALSPAGARDLILMNSKADIRDVLGSVQCPTLVLHRTGDRDTHVEEGRYIAARIPGARYVELTGDDHVVSANPDQIVDEVEEFLTGVRPVAATDRVLATVLFTDLVGSTERATELGDSDWASLLQRHNALVRRELERYAGEEIDTAGDGFLASFDGPARAVRCGLGVVGGLRELGLEVRAGVHTGEVERRPGDKPRGIAVHLGARIMSLAGTGEVLVSSTTRDLVAGSGLEFEDRGEHELKGIEGKRRVFAAR